MEYYLKNIISLDKNMKKFICKKRKSKTANEDVENKLLVLIYYQQIEAVILSVCEICVFSFIF